MRTYIYSIRDKLLNTFSPPFHATHDIAAARAVVNLVNNPQAKADGNNLANYPAEHELVRLGGFDDVEGLVPTEMSPNVLGRCDKLSSDPRYYPKDV